MKYKDVNQEFLDEWGYEAQSRMAIEEMSELIQALCKYERHKDNPQKRAKTEDNIKEEIADVLNMVEQLQQYFGEQEIDKIRQQKIERTTQRLQEYKTKKEGK